MKGVFLDQASLLRPVVSGDDDVDLSPLTALFPDWRFYNKTMPEQTAERVLGADIIICNKVVLDRACLQQAIAHEQALRLICVAATGTNNIDLPAAREFGINVCNVTNYATPSVTEHVFALMLALVRRLPDYQRIVAGGRWQRSEQFCLLDFPITELSGRKLGIVGYGELGRSVARVAEAFGMQVLLAVRPGSEACDGRMPLEQMLAEVDVLSLHCPLTADTQGLIGAAELALMQPHALLINTARGGIVDEQALADALRNNRLGGAAVDVLSSEPPVDGNPLLARDIPGLIVTPHIAWASRESRQCLINEIAANIHAWIRREQSNRVC